MQVWVKVKWAWVSQDRHRQNDPTNFLYRILDLLQCQHMRKCCAGLSDQRGGLKLAWTWRQHHSPVYVDLWWLGVANQDCTVHMWNACVPMGMREAKTTLSCLLRLALFYFGPNPSLSSVIDPRVTSNLGCSTQPGSRSLLCKGLCCCLLRNCI